MKLLFRIACLVLILSQARAQDMGFDLADALDDDKPKVTAPPKKDDGFGFDLSDALGDGDDTPAVKPPVVDKPNSGGGGGTIKDSDLFDIGGGGGGGYEPDGGRYPGRDQNPGYDPHGRGQDPGYNPHGAADQPQAEAGSGKIAGIVSAIGVALVGAASSYFAYQKKKLCFKLQGGQDPERGNRHTTQSEPQVLSNLLNKS